MIKIIAIVLASMFSIGTIGYLSLSRDLPMEKAVEGPKAEALAQRMLTAANIAGFRQTNAIGFTFAGSRYHFYDKKRGYLYYKNGDLEVYYKKDSWTGRVFVEGNEVQNREKVRRFIQKAYSHFINDFFWYNPAFHIYSPGAKRYFVDDQTLLVWFSQGGVTPGDRYLFVLDEEGLIRSMSMWVSILPIPGITATFIDYFTTKTGIRLAKKRKILFFTIEISSVEHFLEYPPGGDRKKDIFWGKL